MGRRAITAVAATDFHRAYQMIGIRAPNKISHGWAAMEIDPWLAAWHLRLTGVRNEALL
jgi:hypothetical protein